MPASPDKTPQNDLVTNFKAARRAAVPLICIRTPDPAMTIRTIMTSFNGEAPPFVHWDIVRGLRGLNDEGRAAITMDADQSTSPINALIAADDLPPRSVAFFSNFHRVIGEQGVSQAVWNLRDSFKNESRRVAIFLCPSVDLPAELQQDVLVLDEPLPTAPQLAAIVRDTYKSAKLAKPDCEVEEKAVDALAGLAAFPAEQAAAMSINSGGLDLSALWMRKREMIEQTPGLSVWRGGEKFDDVGGCDNVKSYLSMLIAGEESPRGIVWLDEIEKAMAGSGTDLSGVSTEMEGTLLSWMSDHDANGCIFLGPPGSGKSMIAKATGNTAGVPTIQFDLGAMKGSLVGESNARLRGALKIVDAVTQGRSLFLATCNSMAALSPALRRRFTLATFFFDLPNADERAAIWKLYIKRYAIPATRAAIPQDDLYAGADIRTACATAWRLRISLKEAAKYLVPVGKSAAASTKVLREQANGTFISASRPGAYVINQVEDRGGRTVEVGR